MCQKHLLGEHVETHMFLGTLRKRIAVDGYIFNNLFEPESLQKRHDEIATEMTNRGMNHRSPLEVVEELEHLPQIYRHAKVEVTPSLEDLLNRCPEYRKRFQHS
jgi:hypothetical protein